MNRRRRTYPAVDEIARQRATGSSPQPASSRHHLPLHAAPESDDLKSLSIQLQRAIRVLQIEKEQGCRVHFPVRCPAHMQLSIEEQEEKVAELKARLKSLPGVGKVEEEESQLIVAEISTDAIGEGGQAAANRRSVEGSRIYSFDLPRN